MITKKKILAVIGCTGHITELFLKEFSKQDIKLRILARKPELISERYPNAEIIKGSMLNASDVQKVLQGVDAAFQCAKPSFSYNPDVYIFRDYDGKNFQV